MGSAQKIKFYIKDFFSKCGNLEETADLNTFTEKTLNGKLHFLCSGVKIKNSILFYIAE